MSASSSDSDSDSDQFEAFRKIKINIKPKHEVTAASVQEIKASVELWRPLGPPPPSLSRRQSSMSSVSSIGGPTTGVMQSSPSCSSLVNEFCSRSPFSTFMSRAPSPTVNNNHGDTIPIAVAIQESIELLIKGTDHYCPNTYKPVLISKSVGNIKLAFTNAFAKGICRPSETLKLEIQPAIPIVKFYSSNIVKDLTPESLSSTQFGAQSKEFFQVVEKDVDSDNNCAIFSDNFLPEEQTSNGTKCTKNNLTNNSRLVSLDTDNLVQNLRKMYEKTPSARYFNIDVLRYQLKPIESIDQCPIQVCAYWKLEPKLLKLRIDYKYSEGCNLSIDNFRDISFTANFCNLIKKESGHTNWNPWLNNNNADEINLSSVSNVRQLINGHDSIIQEIQASNSIQKQDITQYSKSNFPLLSNKHLNEPTMTFVPNAFWDTNTSQLVWKFDSLRKICSEEGSGSLFAKLDLRNHPSISTFNHTNIPSAINIRFLVADSSLSKIDLSIATRGYRLSLIKREIRSGRYMSEPLIES